MDLTYEANANSDRREAGGQIAFRIPLGPGPVKNAARYGALSRSERRLSEGEVEERVRFGLMALREIDAFEQNTARWEELLKLASEAEIVAEQWWHERLATASQVGALLDHAHAARTAGAEARADAGTARCALLAATGLPVEEWPRE